MIGYRDRFKAGPHVVGLTDDTRRVDVRVAFDVESICWEPEPDILAVLVQYPQRFERLERQAAVAPEPESPPEPQPEPVPEPQLPPVRRRRRVASATEQIDDPLVDLPVEPADSVPPTEDES